MRSLSQTETWTTREGETIRLEDMETRHIRNLLAMLEREADRLQWAYIWQDYVDVPGPQGEMAQDCFEAAMNEEMELTALDWLEEKPLVQRLREIYAERMLRPVAPGVWA